MPNRMKAAESARGRLGGPEPSTRWARARPAPPGRQCLEHLERGVPEAGVPMHELTSGLWAGRRGEPRLPAARAGTARLGAGRAARR